MNMKNKSVRFLSKSLENNDTVTMPYLTFLKVSFILVYSFLRCACCWRISASCFGCRPRCIFPSSAAPVRLRASRSRSCRCSVAFNCASAFALSVSYSLSICCLASFISDSNRLCICARKNALRNAHITLHFSKSAVLLYRPLVRRQDTTINFNTHCKTTQKCTSLQLTYKSMCLLFTPFCFRMWIVR